MNRRWGRRGRTALAAALAFPIVLLGGCLTRSDALAPTVTIVEPRAGSTRTVENLQIRGYALDDEGIAAIRVDGTDLLADPILQSERGKKLIEFGFTKLNLREGEMTSQIEVVDVNGRSTLFPFTLRIDVTPPTLELLEVQQLGGGLLRIDGVARDNDRVASIRVGGTPLQVAPSTDFPFEIDVEATPGLTIVVEDAAGNRVERAVQ